MKCAAALIAALCLAVTSSLPAPAQTVIPRLGVAPVAGGPLTSTAQLRAHATRLLSAAKTLSLSADEYDALRDGLTSGIGVGYGDIPRHLDAMTSDGPRGYYAIHNVVIPSGQHGWIVTVSNRTTRTTFYIPNACGNVSIVRAAVPAPTAAPPTAPPPTTAPAPVVTATPTAETNASPAATFLAAPTPAPNKNFWQRYGPILGAIVIPLAACAIAGCFSSNGSKTHAPPPAARRTPSPPSHPLPTPPPMRGTPPILIPTPHPTATASCPPLISNLKPVAIRVSPPR